MKAQAVRVSQDGGERYFLEMPHRIWDNTLGGFLAQWERDRLQGEGCPRTLYRGTVRGGCPWASCVYVLVCVCSITRGILELWGSPSFFLLENGLLGLWHPGGKY